ncbi:MAG: preprotein translocase subunit SecG [Deltaproteobacteria bacterium CG_4_9_14_0_2_um_filter_42_21]|nr:MAG: preprotein translocase subunit SecG [Deltaproteobacteria bacterium CG_4_9_14_0_2_um_filter_42_21]
MHTIVLTIHYILCIFLVVTILLQTGKGADIGAVFGGGSQTLFGGRGPATFLNKLTAAVAIMFLLTSVSLAKISKENASSSVFEKVNIPASESSTAPEAAPQATEKEAVPEKPKAK